MANDFGYRVRGFYGRIPSEPHHLMDWITPTDGCIVLCHLGVPEVEGGDDWTVEVCGLVERPKTFSVAELKRLERTEITAVHQCAGSPLAPDKPTQRVCNVHWAGVRLQHVLTLVGARSSADFVWSHGADSGEFGGIACGHYVKDLPLARAADDVLLAYEMNGSALLPEHGYPLRLVVPGFYGTNSVKWLRRIELQTMRAPGPFTRQWYNDAMPDGSTRPVWNIAPQSGIVSPKPDSRFTSGELVQIWGWAWADAGLTGVDLSDDEGQTWQPCRLEAPSGRSWTKFTCDWSASAGCAGLLSRAAVHTGDRQPAGGRRNAVYRVPLSVV